MHTSSYVPMIPPSVSNGNSTAVARLNTGYRRMLNTPKLSTEGVSFLKCAFAPPDFSVNKISGVPDKYEGNSLVKKHRLINPETFDAVRDYYFWLAPIPGVAYLKTNVAAGTPLIQSTTWTPVYYSDYDNMFGVEEHGYDSANKVTKFRFVSNHIEMVPTVNQMEWSGSIQAFKIPATLNVRQLASDSNRDLYSIMGLQACNSTNSNQYSGPFFNGLYSGCFSSNCDFTFQQVLEGLGPSIPTTVYAETDFTQIISRIPGMDNGFESLIVKISGVTSTKNAALFKTWSCVEYQVQAGTDLYEYQTESPCDEAAIAAYKKLISELPVGVCYMDNENFWRRVLNILRGVSGALSFVPGPYGAVASGVNTITNGISELL